MASLHEGCRREKWAGKPGQGFRHSQEPREKLGIRFVEDPHPNHGVWAVLLQSHLRLTVGKQLLLLGIEGSLVGGGRHDGLRGAGCPPTPCLAGIHAPCSLPVGQKGSRMLLGSQSIIHKVPTPLLKEGTAYYSFHHNKI